MSNVANAVAVIEAPAESRSLATKVSLAWGLTPQKAEKMIARYGQETISCAMEIKQDMLTVGLGYFHSLVQKGFEPEQVKTLYLTKAMCVDKAKEDQQWCSVSLVQLARLADKFEDFRIADEGGQYEFVDEIVHVFSRCGFRKAVDGIIKRASELDIRSFEEMMLAADEYADGTVFNSYFSDDEEKYWWEW